MKITDQYGNELNNNDHGNHNDIDTESHHSSDELFRNAEPIAQSLRIFNIFDIDKNTKIDFNELKVICKSLNLHPNTKELKSMIVEVSDSSDFTVSFEQFRAMRVLKKACELNVLAEFKKFDIHKIQRGIVTKDCIRKVLKAEPQYQEDNESLEKRIQEIMSYDSDRDGLLTFKDFYDNMLRRVPQEWLNWIYENLMKGVREEFIRMSLEVNGVDSALAQSLLQKTKKEGLLTIGKTFVDQSKSYIYVMKS
eukprot:403342237